MRRTQAEFETRSLPIEAGLKDLDAKQGIITGYWASYNVEDEIGDIIAPGAFAKTIAEWGPSGVKPRIKYLYMHDPFQALGKPSVLREDDFGLYYEAKVVQTTWGRDVLLLYEEGIINEHSIGFRTIKSEVVGNDGRRLLEIRLYEGSAVLWGMNPNTPTTGMKGSEGIIRLSDRIARAEKALRRADWKSDELPEAVELLMTQWRTEVQALEALAGQEPSAAAGRPQGTPPIEPLPTAPLHSLMAEMRADLARRSTVSP